MGYKSKIVTEDLELSTISKIDVVRASAIPEQSTIPSSKHSKKKQHIKATPTESKYSSALKGKELEEDKFETKTPKKIDELKTVTKDLELSTISKIDVVKPSAIPEQSTIPSSKHSKKKQKIKATPKEKKKKKKKKK